ncbi:fimbrial protein [Salmonella enterica subsp. salamae]|uniref:Fimbrial protein n=4 Tax=Salmonella enterica TaxID=28901 RepID=A0A379QRU3_SALER|nr:fimbrial-like protein [Salmonella enterica]EBP3214927.1 fimbrial-like protein [Salmonella enterica subsp. arizonae]ECC1483379.1 fimbrial-like protein [Salmonella enterica subsp. salamae]ECI8273895.1 fimbrial-like protein [Salmonella enterica subsp. enterica]EDR2773098.1 fimbrial-like protein [Salmonella enterica subsp. enterica serovar Oslo]EEC4249716.1 fimbrial-like protein [Salmonella enterica subsp. diarizonae]EHM1753268.1 fimbrial-like protein [Salmonella enterica subsp. salamae serova
MLNKTLLAVVTASLFSGMAFNASAADQGHGKITFTGTVISAPCSIPAEDVNKTVDLGEVGTAALNGGKNSLPVAVDIHLQDCVLSSGSGAEATTITKAKVTFTSANADATTSLLKNTAEGNYGGAGNVGVRLLTEGLANVTMGTEVPVDLVAENSYQVLKFKARMERVATGTDATAGNVATDVNYVLAYE